MGVLVWEQTPNAQNEAQGKLQKLLQDLEMSVDQKLTELSDLLTKFLPNAAQVLSLVEAARSGFAAGQLQAVSQSLGTIAVVNFALTQSGRLSALQGEKIRLTTTLIMAAVLQTASPEDQASFPITVGLYKAGETQAVVGPFLGECFTSIMVSDPQGGQTFELQECL